MLTSEIHVNKCACGWNFPAYSKDIKKCPQCQDEKKICKRCGESCKDNYCKKCLTKKDVYCPVCGNEKEEYQKPFCNHCANIEKNIKFKNMSKRIERIKTFKENQESCPHGYDCSNCPEDDCIIPSDDFQMVLY